MTRKQRGVGLGMAAGFALCSLVLLYPGNWPGALPPTAGLAARLTYAVRADAIAMLWLLAAIGNVARGRFFSAADIDGSGFAGPSPRIGISVAVVQNTLEQAVLSAILYPALACLPGQDGTALIPRLLTLFCLGRFAFWLGYRHGAPWRAFGFATTFYPIVFGYVVAIFYLIRSA